MAVTEHRIVENVMNLIRHLTIAAVSLLVLTTSAAAQAWHTRSEINFTIAKEEPRGVWILNSSTGSVRFCKSAAPNALPVCSKWSDPAETASGLGLASVNCGKRTYNLSTGTSTGNCSTSGSPAAGNCGPNTQASCTDPKGNAATVNCDDGTGLGSCTTAGSGSCREVNAAN